MIEEKQIVANKLGISVVIPNYNGKTLLEENLPSLYEALNYSKIRFEIIIADDASKDDSINFIENHYPEIIIIKNNINRGFSSNINSGIFQAKLDYVFLLNSDVKLTPSYFGELLQYFNASNTFGVMGRIIGYDNDEIQDAAKQKENTVLKISANSNIVPLNPDQLFFPTFFLSGANALVCRKKLFLLQGFDEIYSPFYGEDLDLSIRAWRLGWKCYYHHNAICRHPSSVTINKYHKKKKIKIIVYRNRLLLHAIHLNKNRLKYWNIWVIIQLVAHSLLLRFEFIKAFFLYLKLKDKVKESIQRIKHLGDAQNNLHTVEDIISLINKEQINSKFKKL
ncbi:MAG: glycosyltransferase [Cytophagales bacterium]|nr:MAG: glycosyltransferase [Cytophagales bacterium]